MVCERVGQCAHVTKETVSMVMDVWALWPYPGRQRVATWCLHEGTCVEARWMGRCSVPHWPGLAAYMVSVGWQQAQQANLIAEIAGFFVAVAGLAVALAPRRAAPPPELHRGGQLQSPSQIRLKMQRISSGRNVNVVTDARPEDKVTTDMWDVTAERSIHHRIKAAPRCSEAEGRR
jgi:hypothetical protein